MGQPALDPDALDRARGGDRTVARARGPRPGNLARTEATEIAAGEDRGCALAPGVAEPSVHKREVRADRDADGGEDRRPVEIGCSREADEHGALVRSTDRGDEPGLRSLVAEQVEEVDLA